jgi:hypothetical protein
VRLPIANAAPAETIIPAAGQRAGVNVRYVRTAIYVRLSHDISALAYRGQYAGPINAPGRCGIRLIMGEAGAVSGVALGARALLACSGDP